jgi:hypothetical protein
MNPQIDPRKVTRLLTQSSEQLGGAVAEALVEARHRALDKQSARMPVFAFAGGHWLDRVLPHSAMQWLAAGFFAMLLVAGGAEYWHFSEERQASEIDLAILTDEMPVHVFVN